MKEDKESAEIRDKMKLEIMQLLQNAGTVVRESEMSTTEKLIRADMLIDTMRFVDEYETNSKVLGTYWREENKRRKVQKFQEER